MAFRLLSVSLRARALFSLISRRDHPYAGVSISPLRPLLVRSDEGEPRPILEVILEEERGSPSRLVRRNFHQRLSTQGNAHVAQPIPSCGEICPPLSKKVQI